MSWDDEYPRYVTVAERKRLAAQKAKSLKLQGYKLEPLGELKSRTKIASSFWGRSWCRHLESFSDYENRLPRGRSYVRNGAILHLGIEAGKINAMVQGSELYELTIDIDPLPAEQWAAVKTACQGKIATLIELLQGKISDEIMSVVTDPNQGLFPKPKQIHFNCNCPDWADMCKHVAAVLYGVAARLDDSPELLFTLRGVDLNELISLDTSQQSIASGSRRSRRRTLSDDAVNDVFGIASEEEKNDDDATANQLQPNPEVAAPQTVTQIAQHQDTIRTHTFSLTAADIRQLRERLGLSKTAFAKIVGASAPTISSWERKTGELTLQAKHRKALEQLSRQ